MELLVSWTGCSCQVGGDSELRRLRLLSEFVCPRLSLWTVPAVADASKLFIVLSSYQLLGSLDASLELLEVGQSKPSRQSKGYKTSKPRKSTESLDARKPSTQHGHPKRSNSCPSAGQFDPVKVWSPSDKAEFVTSFKGQLLFLCRNCRRRCSSFAHRTCPYHPARTASGTFLLEGVC